MSLCNFCGSGAFIGIGRCILQERFVRVPTLLMESFMRRPFSGTQLRIILWVIRQTYGWNRLQARFSWYRIAVDLGADRGGVVRAGKKLCKLGLLATEGHLIGVSRITDETGSADKIIQPGAKAETPGFADENHLIAPTGKLADVDIHHRLRCRESSVFTRAKDSTKERSKINRNANGRFGRPSNEPAVAPLRRSAAGEAKQTRKKYEHLSRN